MEKRGGWLTGGGRGRPESPRGIRVFGSMGVGTSSGWLGKRRGLS